MQTAKPIKIRRPKNAKKNIATYIHVSSLFSLLGDIDDTVVCVDKEIHRSQASVDVTVEKTVVLHMSAQDMGLVEMTSGDTVLVVSI